MLDFLAAIGVVAAALFVLHIVWPDNYRRCLIAFLGLVLVLTGIFILSHSILIGAGAGLLSYAMNTNNEDCDWQRACFAGFMGGLSGLLGATFVAGAGSLATSIAGANTLAAGFGKVCCQSLAQAAVNSGLQVVYNIYEHWRDKKSFVGMNQVAFTGVGQAALAGLIAGFCSSLAEVGVKAISDNMVKSFNSVKAIASPTHIVRLTDALRSQQIVIDITLNVGAAVLTDVACQLATTSTVDANQVLTAAGVSVVVAVGFASARYRALRNSSIQPAVHDDDGCIDLAGVSKKEGDRMMKALVRYAKQEVSAGTAEKRTFTIANDGNRVYYGEHRSVMSRLNRADRFFAPTSLLSIYSDSQGRLRFPFQRVGLPSLAPPTAYFGLQQLQQHLSWSGYTPQLLPPRQASSPAVPSPPGPSRSKTLGHDDGAPPPGSAGDNPAPASPNKPLPHRAPHQANDEDSDAAPDDLEEDSVSSLDSSIGDNEQEQPALVYTNFVDIYQADRGLAEGHNAAQFLDHMEDESNPNTTEQLENDPSGEGNKVLAQAAAVGRRGGGETAAATTVTMAARPDRAKDDSKELKESPAQSGPGAFSPKPPTSQEVSGAPLVWVHSLFCDESGELKSVPITKPMPETPKIIGLLHYGDAACTHVVLEWLMAKGYKIPQEDCFKATRDPWVTLLSVGESARKTGTPIFVDCHIRTATNFADAAELNPSPMLHVLTYLCCDTLVFKMPAFQDLGAGSEQSNEHLRNSFRAALQTLRDIIDLSIHTGHGGARKAFFIVANVAEADILQSCLREGALPDSDAQDCEKLTNIQITHKVLQMLDIEVKVLSPLSTDDKTLAEEANTAQRHGEVIALLNDIIEKTPFHFSGAAVQQSLHNSEGRVPDVCTEDIFRTTWGTIANSAPFLKALKLKQEETNLEAATVRNPEIRNYRQHLSGFLDFVVKCLDQRMARLGDQDPVCGAIHASLAKFEETSLQVVDEYDFEDIKDEMLIPELVECKSFLDIFGVERRPNRMAADGDCFFHAVVHQLSALPEPIKFMKRNSAECASSPMCVRLLRQLIVQRALHLRKERRGSLRHIFEKHSLADAGWNLPMLENLHDQLNDISKDHIRRYERSGEWLQQGDDADIGDSLIQLLSYTFASRGECVSIVVYDSNSYEVKMRWPDQPVAHKCLHLLHNGYHYDSAALYSAMSAAALIEAQSKPSLASKGAAATDQQMDKEDLADDRLVLSVCCPILRAHVGAPHVTAAEQLPHACLDALSAALQMPAEDARQRVAYAGVKHFQLLNLLENYLEDDAAWKVLEHLASTHMLVDMIRWGFVHKAQTRLRENAAGQSALHAAVARALAATLVHTTEEEEIKKQARRQVDGDLQQDMTSTIAMVGSYVRGPCDHLAAAAIENRGEEQLQTLKAKLTTTIRGIPKLSAAGAEERAVMHAVVDNALRCYLATAVAKKIHEWSDLIHIIVEAKYYEDESARAACWVCMERLLRVLPILRHQGLIITRIHEAIQLQLSKFLAPWARAWQVGDPTGHESQPQAHAAALLCARQCMLFDDHCQSSDQTVQRMDNSARTRVRTMQDLEEISPSRVLQSPLRDEFLDCGMTKVYLEFITNNCTAHGIRNCLKLRSALQSALPTRTDHQRARLREVVNLLLYLEPLRWFGPLSKEFIRQVIRGAQELRKTIEPTSAKEHESAGPSAGEVAASSAAPAASAASAAPAASAASPPANELGGNQELELGRATRLLYLLLRFACCQIRAAAVAERAERECGETLQWLKEVLIDEGLAGWYIQNAQLEVAGVFAVLVWNLGCHFSETPELAVVGSELLWQKLESVDLAYCPAAEWVVEQLRPSFRAAAIAAGAEAEAVTDDVVLNSFKELAKAVRIDQDIERALSPQVEEGRRMAHDAGRAARWKDKEVLREEDCSAE